MCLATDPDPSIIYFFYFWSMPEINWCSYLKHNLVILMWWFGEFRTSIRIQTNAKDTHSIFSGLNYFASKSNELKTLSILQFNSNHSPCFVEWTATFDWCSERFSTKGVFGHYKNAWKNFGASKAKDITFISSIKRNTFA